MNDGSSGPGVKGPSIPGKIFSGYMRLFAAVSLWALAAIGAVAAAAAIVWPLWALAMRNRGLFNALFIAVSALLLATVVALGLRRRIASGEAPAAIAAKAGRALAVVLAFLGLLFFAYLCAAFAFRGIILAAVPSGAASLGLSGWLFFGRKRA